METLDHSRKSTRGCSQSSSPHRLSVVATGRVGVPAVSLRRTTSNEAANVSLVTINCPGVHMDPVSTALGTVLGIAAGYYWRGDGAALPNVPKCPEPPIQTCEVCLECPQISGFGQSVDSGGDTLL